MLIENIKEAIQNLLSNKMRSILTMLGIIIGISAVITITTIGNSIKTTLNATMNSLGGNSVQVYLDAVIPEDVDADWQYPEMTENDYLTEDMMKELMEQYPDEISGYINNVDFGSGKFQKNTDTYANVYASGVNTYFLDYSKLKLLYGRNISQSDCDKTKKVCVVSDTMVKNYFGDENPLGKQMEFTSDMGSVNTFVVIGVYEYNEAFFGKPDTSVPEKDRVTQIYIPSTTAADLNGSNVTGFENITVTVNPTSDLQLAQVDINDFFSQKYADNENWRVTCYNLSSDMKMIDTVINVITIAISFIAAISLIVGGVGVMNIMLVSITERTKEIGIRKALGAKNANIKQQFLIESIVLCLIGGAIGIIIGLLLGVVIGKVAGFAITNFYPDYADFIVMTIHPSTFAIVLSLLFSMLIGVFFGNYPAKKAAKMEVIDALRYE